MDDLIHRSALRDALYDADAITFRGLEILNTFPAVNAMEIKTLQKMIRSEYARLYSCDEKMLENMGGYNQSHFTAGYKYALDCVMGKLTLLTGERSANETN